MQSKDRSREVNNILHTLRGEQFRQLQNVRRSRTGISVPGTHNAPTLPARFTALEYESAISPSPSDPSSAGRTVTYSGPAPPKSWKTSFEKEDRDSVQWHTQALGLAASHLGNFTETPRVPSLALLCLKMILSNCTSKAGFCEDVVPYLPAPLRRDVIRYCAVHSPLPNWKLQALFEPEGNADGEILIMGPAATLSEDRFVRPVASEELDRPEDSQTPRREADWDADEIHEQALHSLILVSTRLSTNTLLTLPPTITRLTLVDLANPIPIHRLPKLCPMVQFLDLSFNKWLQSPDSEGVKSLEKTTWGRWKDLEILGLRDCYVPDDFERKINSGRWDDVKVITN